MLQSDPLVDELPKEGIFVKGSKGGDKLLASVLVPREWARIKSPMLLLQQPLLLLLALLLGLLLLAWICHGSALGHSCTRPGESRQGWQVFGGEGTGATATGLSTQLPALKESAPTETEEESERSLQI